MNLSEKIALKLLKVSGYRLYDIWDSWQLILADKTEDNRISRWRKLYRHLLFDAIQDQIDRHAIDLVVDIGAHVGAFAMTIRRRGFSGEILSVEPNPELATMLSNEAIKDSAWEVRQVAVGSERGLGTLQITSDSSFASLKDTNETATKIFGDLVSIAANVETEIVTLSQLLDEYSERQEAPGSIFLKTDTQGNDLEVVLSAGNWIRTVKALLIEIPVMPIYEGVESLSGAHTKLEEWGFHLVGMYPVSWDDAGAVVEFDALYAI